MHKTEIPKVSVFCVCYNHEKYMKKALESVFSQKTNFPFEVLIHDDASTDNSRNILLEYKNKYPNQVNLVLQTENQYKKGKSASTFLLPKAHGEYIAFLELDDFWCDENKLQRQVDILEKYSTVNMCIHRCQICTEEGTPVKRFIPASQYEEQVFSGSECIYDYPNKWGQTASRMVRKSFLISRYNSDDEYMQPKMSMGDLQEFLYASTHGSTYYIPDVMSFYRENSMGSHTKRRFSDLDYAKKTLSKEKRIWEDFGAKYPQYVDVCKKQIDRTVYEEIYMRISHGNYKEYKEIYKYPLSEYTKKLSIHTRIKGWIHHNFPQSVQIWKTIKAWVKHEK